MYGSEIIQGYVFRSSQGNSKIQYRICFARVVRKAIKIQLNLCCAFEDRKLIQLYEAASR